MKKYRYQILFLIIILIRQFIFAGEKVYVNQVGYLTASNKYVFVSKPAESFKILNISDKSIVFSGKFNLYITNDLSSGLTTYKGDFTELKKPGKYILISSNNDTSYQFQISDTVYNDVYKKTMKSYYFQRCGSDLLYQYAGVYQRAKCHQTDALFHLSTNRSGFNPATGGWHDAGDYGKYVVNAGVSVGTLLLGYELMPDKFYFDDLNIPESKNGVPDILDEVRYELEWLIKMQDTISGGVFTKLTRQDFEGFVMPADDKGTRYIYQISSCATGDFCSMTAMAARLYKKYDPEFSVSCLNAAKKAWNYLTKNTSIVPTGGFKNPSGTSTGEYGDFDDRDERLWAAVELFKSTGEDLYHNYFLAHYADKGLFNSTMSWSDVGPLALLSYLTSNQSNKNIDVSNKILAGLNNYCQLLSFRQMNDGFDLVLSKDEYNWGSNSTILNEALLLEICGIYNKNSKYTEIALEQLNYVFGINYYNISYVTGIGSKYVMTPHHRPSASDGIVQPIPGFIAGGPNRNLDDNVLKSLYTRNTPPMQCYTDNVDSYASNEICLNWNAPLVFLTGMFSNTHDVTGIQIEKSVPSEIELNQNYPNPFNGLTHIKYSIKKPQNVSFKLFDILGRQVWSKFLGFKESGNYELTWDAKSDRDSSVSSGIYYYFIEGLGRSEIKKLILLF
jgi:endoglucanase